VTRTDGSSEPDTERVSVMTVRCTVEPHETATLRIRVTSWPTLDAAPRESLHASVDDALKAIADFLHEVAS
jgi:hypothetical protein